MKKQFVRGGTSKIEDREYKRGLAAFCMAVALLTVSLCLSGCFGERVSEQQHLDSPALAPGVSFSDKSPAVKRLLQRRPIVDRTGTILCMSKEDPERGALRIKPYKGLFDQIIGYVDDFGRGLEGVEFVYDDYLSRPPSKEDPFGSPLVLSVEKNLQTQCKENLAWQMKRLRSKSGAMIIMDVKTGNILAMTSIDASRSGDEGAQEENLTTQRLVNPWPVIVTLAQAKAMEDRVRELEAEQAKAASEDSGADEKSSKKTNTQTKIDTKSVIKTGRWHWHYFGDDAAIWTRVHEDEFEGFELDQGLLSSLIGLGLGQETTIDLPEERQGMLPPALSANVTDMISSPAGATPVQLLVAYTTLLRNGELVRPRLAMNGETDSKDESGPGKRLFSETGQRLFRSVFGDNKGPSLASFAQKECNGNKCYEVVGLGFWPAENPKVSYISVLFDAKYSPARRRGTLGRMIHLARKGASALKEQYRFVKNSSMGQMSAGKVGDQDKYPERMPDLRGLSIRSALEVAGRLGMKIRISGTGKVKEQYPRPGSRISKSTECVLLCKNNPV